jgi:hypothetical protein
MPFVSAAVHYLLSEIRREMALTCDVLFYINPRSLVAPSPRSRDLVGMTPTYRLVSLKQLPTATRTLCVESGLFLVMDRNQYSPRTGNSLLELSVFSYDTENQLSF